MAVAENKTQKYRNGLANFEMYSNVFIIYELSSAQAVLHGSSMTWFQTSNLIQSNKMAVAENKTQK